MTDHRRILVLVPPGTEVQYAENAHIDQPAIIDRDCLDRIAADNQRAFTPEYRLPSSFLGVSIEADTSQFDAAIERTKRQLWPLLPPQPGTHESDLYDDYGDWDGVVSSLYTIGVAVLPGGQVEYDAARAWSRANRSQPT